MFPIGSSAYTVNKQFRVKRFHYRHLLWIILILRRAFFFLLKFESFFFSLFNEISVRKISDAVALFLRWKMMKIAFYRKHLFRNGNIITFLLAYRLAKFVSSPYNKWIRESSGQFYGFGSRNPRCISIKLYCALFEA